LPNEMCSIRLREEKMGTESIQSDIMLTSSAAIVTVWFVAITGTMFACLRVETKADVRGIRQAHARYCW